MDRKERLALLFGGKSGEHEVSLRSAFSVYKHLDPQLYDVLLIGISRDGRWYLQSGIKSNGEALTVVEDDNNLVAALPGSGLYRAGEKLQVDVVFPILHGSFGEDGTVQGLLELVGLPYAGAGILGSSLAMDKGAAKEIWASRGLPTVPFMRLDQVEYKPGCSDFLKKLDAVFHEFGLPLFVKPLRAGSSVGVSRVESRDALEAAIEEALRFDTAAMLEPAIDGREIECSVIGNFETESFPPGEILPSHAFYDYEAKYIDPDGAILELPANIPVETAKEIRRIAEEAYRAAGAEGMARVDFFLEKKSGRVLLNEINTIPGFTSISMFPRMCEAGGLAYPDLLRKMIELGKERFEGRSRCIYSLMLKTGTEA
jgi:D-alanine-D-alanine ligase